MKNNFQKKLINFINLSILPNQIIILNLKNFWTMINLREVWKKKMQFIASRKKIHRLYNLKNPNYQVRAKRNLLNLTIYLAMFKSEKVISKFYILKNKKLKKVIILNHNKEILFKLRKYKLIQILNQHHNILGIKRVYLLHLILVDKIDRRK